VGILRTTAEGAEAGRPDMHGPALVGWLLVMVGAATGLLCLLRTRPGCAGGADRHAARDEGLMGFGMAVMAVPVSVLDPRPWGPPLFAVAFGAAAVRALLLARRDGRHAHHAHHAVGAGAMAYMAVAMVPGGTASHDGHVPGGAPLLTGLLLAYFAAYVLAAGVRLASVPVVVQAGGGGVGELPRPPAVATVGRGLRAPEMAAACRVSMAIGMLAMLLTL
jgi:hypothetical protein